MLKVARRATDEPCVQTESEAPRMQAGDDEPPSRLDVHASAALDRLTRWAAKTLRASVAVVMLANGKDDLVASHTGAEGVLASARLREFERQVMTSHQPHAIGDVRGTGADEVTDVEGIAFLGAPLLDADGAAIGSFCVMDVRPRAWTIQDVELVNELTSSAMTELDLRLRAG